MLRETASPFAASVTVRPRGSRHWRRMNSPGCGGLYINMEESSLVVVQVANISGMAILESENHPPVGANCHRPRPGIVPTKRMQPEPWQIHVARSDGGIQAHQDFSHSLSVFLMHAPFIAAFHETPKRPAPETPDHDDPQHCLLQMSTSSRQAWACALTMHSAADPETLFHAWIHGLQVHTDLTAQPDVPNADAHPVDHCVGARRETPLLLQCVSTATDCARYRSGTRPARLSVASQKSVNRTLAGAYRGPRARVRRWLPGDCPAGLACKGRLPDRPNGQQIPRSIAGWPLRGDAPGGPVRRRPGHRS